MTRSSTRRARTARPGLEGLEGRQLLSAGPDPAPPTGRAIDLKAGVPASDRRLTYTTPQGTHVVITLYGVGSLAGSSHDPDGALNLVFSGTNEFTGIIGKVSGGTGQAPLRTIRNLDEGLDNFSGVTSTVLNVVNLKNFNLVDGGQINLTGGVHTLFLNSVGANTQVHIRALPSAFNPGSGNTATAVNNGVTLQFLQNVTGARTLTSVAGTPVITNFALIANNQPTSAITNGVNPGPPPAPPGAVISIGSVRGVPRNPSTLEDPQVFGYDPALNALVRFDAKSGAALQAIPLTGMGTLTTGVALGRDNGRLVALIGNSTTVFAFDALTGARVGQFTTANLGSFNSIDGIGSTDNRTVLMDASSGPFGMAQIIDLTASLATGQVVPVGAAFAPSREFGFAGGMSGVAARNIIYASGAAFFDTAQPNLTQFGVLDIDTTGGVLRESGRTALQVNGADVNAGPLGTVQSLPIQALGSIDQSLALVTGVTNGKNVVALLNPETLKNQGTVTLDDPNLLTGLSESFRPNLVDAALVDIQGTLQSFRSTDVNGLVFNDLGAANLVKIHRAANSTFVADPFGHAEMPQRTNVTILSSKRPVGQRNGITIDPNLAPIGPLSLPTPGKPT